MRKTYSVKSLLLVLPETAQQRGIRAEAPLFISPNIERPHHCGFCTATFTPLVYQTGYTTQAQHFHETDGGIYYFVAASFGDVTSLAERTGWLAVVEPVGATCVYEMHGTTYGRAEAVTVTAITAWCMVNGIADYCLSLPDHRRHSLSAGALAECPCADGVSSFLMPVCDADDPEADYAPYFFQVRDGVVYFSRYP